MMVITFDFFLIAKVYECEKRILCITIYPGYGHGRTGSLLRIWVYECQWELSVSGTCE
jgi:hypothetical protein